MLFVMATVKGSGTSTKLSRRESAKATQWRIVKAAYELFCEQGYAATTMAQIAESAGVAVQTVYFVFHSKSALLSRAIDFAVLGESDPEPPQRRPWYRAMAAEPDVGRALRHFVTGASELIRRVTPIEVAAQVASDADPETRRVIELHERWRADDFRAVVEILTATAPLRPEVTAAQATDVLLLFLSSHHYRVLTEERGWSPDVWVDWTVEALAAQLFGSSSP